jgi:polar amino acid transport system permease protein
VTGCLVTIQDYGLRALGIGERLLPKSDITLCEQFVLIGSGLLWNIYFGFVAMLLGFWLATALALGKHSRSLVAAAAVTLFCVFIPRLTIIHPVFSGL